LTTFRRFKIAFGVLPNKIAGTGPGIRRFDQYDVTWNLKTNKNSPEMTAPIMVINNILTLTDRYNC
jgi:hypothetical protein